MNQTSFTGYLNQLVPINLNMLLLRGSQENHLPVLQYQSNQNHIPCIIKGSYFLHQPATNHLATGPSTPNFIPGRFYLDPIKSEYGTSKIEENLSSQSKPFMKQEEAQPKGFDGTLRKNIAQIVNFILNEFGKGKKQIDEHRNLYKHNTLLLGLFDKLVEKYSAAAKCREDMVRFVLRKALSFLRDSLKTKLNISAKAASLALCKRYFKIADEETLKKELNTDDEEELLNFLLPYKKNSRNKTANTRFMIEIFASEAFHQDYKDYLLKFDDILEHDNQKKIEKLVDFLVQCVHRNSIADIKKYKRLPWLKIWSESTKIIAYELLNTKTWKNAIIRSKKVKSQKTKEENVKVEDISVDN